MKAKRPPSGKGLLKKTVLKRWHKGLNSALLKYCQSITKAQTEEAVSELIAARSSELQSIMRIKTGLEELLNAENK